jgi:FkbM family methyltransferase
LRPFAPVTLIDVGANVGEWALAACRALPGATVHAFEIAPKTADRLASSIDAAGRREQVVINRLGLADVEGEIALYLTLDSDTESSTLRAAVEFAAKDRGLGEVIETTARVTTGDAYLRAHAITHVDLLKIDVEGAEFSVLEGFADSFACGAIDMV